MRTIYKFPFKTSMLTVRVSPNAEVKFVGLDPASKTNTPALWIELESDQLVTDRRFAICGTGHVIPFSAEHVGSVIDGQFVWHIYEII